MHIGQSDMTESTGYLIEKLEALLTEAFSAEGEGLQGKLRSVGRELPDDLRGELSWLALERGEQDEDGELGFAFRCGQAYAHLEALAQNRLASNIAYVGTDGTPPLDLEKKDLDAIAHVVKLRDQFLIAVADYTLKFLLVSAILLVLGLALGLI
jgi:hypothetical protein